MRRRVEVFFMVIGCASVLRLGHGNTKTLLSFFPNNMEEVIQKEEPRFLEPTAIPAPLEIPVEAMKRVGGERKPITKRQRFGMSNLSAFRDSRVESISVASCSNLAMRALSLTLDLIHFQEHHPRGQGGVHQ